MRHSRHFSGDVLVSQVPFLSSFVTVLSVCLLLCYLSVCFFDTVFWLENMLAFLVMSSSFFKHSFPFCVHFDLASYLRLST